MRKGLNAQRSAESNSPRSDRYSNPRSHGEAGICARWRWPRRRSRRRPGWCWRRRCCRQRRWARGRRWASRCRWGWSRYAAERRLGGCWPWNRADLTRSPEPLGSCDRTPVRDHTREGEPAERSDAGKGQGRNRSDDSWPHDALSSRRPVRSLRGAPSHSVVLVSGARIRLREPVPTQERLSTRIEH